MFSNSVLLVSKFDFEEVALRARLQVASPSIRHSTSDQHKRCQLTGQTYSQSDTRTYLAAAAARGSLHLAGPALICPDTTSAARHAHAHARGQSQQINRTAPLTAGHRRRYADATVFHSQHLL